MRGSRRPFWSSSLARGQKRSVWALTRRSRFMLIKAARCTNRDKCGATLPDSATHDPDQVALEPGCAAFRGAGGQAWPSPDRQKPAPVQPYWNKLGNTDRLLGVNDPLPGIQNRPRAGSDAGMRAAYLRREGGC